VNQALGTVLAAIALLAIGSVNVAGGVSNVRKQNRSRLAAWARIFVGLFLLVAALWFRSNLHRGFFG
jgi:hypothetical protein